MPYAEGRTYNDADSHIMETRDWLASYIDPRLRDRACRRRTLLRLRAHGRCDWQGPR